MLFTTEIRGCVGNEEGLDIRHESLGRAEHAPHVRVDAGDDQLITTVMAQQLPEVGALKCRIPPLRHLDVAGAWCQRFDHLGVAARRKSGSPEIGENATS